MGMMDEFGRDLYHNQGKIQPFGYTGYQMDAVAGTYYAQAREYCAGDGRFVSQDIIKGTIEQPYTLNQYVYCWNQPLEFVDLDGLNPNSANNISIQVPKSQVDLSYIKNAANRKPVSLGKGWYYRFDSEPHPHMHLYEKKD